MGPGTSGIGPGTGGSIGRDGRPGHVAKAPSVRPGVTTVNGHLPPEVIQRIVRQNYGRFRQCYESGLRTNPNLTGRVSARFVIGRDGAVTNVSNGGGDLAGLERHELRHQRLLRAVVSVTRQRHRHRDVSDLARAWLSR